MERRFENLTDRRGNSIVSATVTVYDADGAIATIYSDDGVTEVSNPLYTDDDGEYTYFAPNGKYSEQIVAEGYGSETRDNVILFDPTDLDVSSSTAYTLTAADMGRWLDFDTSNTATVYLTTANGYTTAGTTVLSQKGAGKVVVSAGTGVTLRCSDTASTRTVDAVIALTYLGSATYLVYGDLDS